jgi:hypothetical protein
MKDPAEMTTAEYSALASSGKLPKPVPAVPTPEVLIDPATGQPYPADRQYPAINPATGQPYPVNYIDPATGQPYPHPAAGQPWPSNPEYPGQPHSGPTGPTPIPG